MTSRGPAAREHLGAGRAAKWGSLSRPGVFDGWFPLFPISYMQIVAPAPAGGAAQTSRCALEGKCGSRRRLCSFVIHVFACGDPRSLIFPRSV